MATHKVRLGILLAKVEGTEGTWQDPVAETNAATLYDVTYTTEPRLYDRKPYKAEFSTLPALKGGTTGTLSFKVELAGAGSTAVTAPFWTTPLIPCGWQNQAIEEIPLSAAPAAGDLIPGEIITGGTSSVTAKFIRYILDGAAHKMLVSEMSGVGQAETWTGSVSGNTAIATADAGATTLAYLLRPDSSPSSYSIALYEPYGVGTNSTKFCLEGCRGSWKIGASAIGEPIFIECEIKGNVYDVIDEATPSAVYQNYTGLPFVGSNFFSMAAESSGVAATNLKISSFSIDSGAEITVRDSANDNGYVSAMITDRNIKGSFDPELVEVGTADFWSEYDSDSYSVLQCNLGSTAGGYVDLYAGNVRYQGYSAGDRGGIRTLDMPFGIHRIGLSEDYDVLILTR